MLSRIREKNTKDERHMNQVPTTAKFSEVADSGLTRVSADITGSLLADCDARSGVQMTCELWLTLAFLSKATQRKLSEITWRWGI